MLLSLNPLPLPQAGFTALLKATKEGHIAVVQALLEAGADIDIKDKVRSSAFRLVELCYGIM